MYYTYLHCGRCQRLTVFQIQQTLTKTNASGTRVLRNYFVCIQCWNFHRAVDGYIHWIDGHGK